MGHPPRFSMILPVSNARREGQALHFSMKRAEIDQITQIKMITICCHEKIARIQFGLIFLSLPSMKPVTTTPAAIHLALLVNMLSMGSMMMVMPLGPDLVTSLGMAPEQTGYFSGGATQGAALIELIAAPWLDRVNRKPALLMLLTLRFLLLMACALVQNSQQLLVLFVLSGCVAGPLAPILMAAVLDLVPPAEPLARLMSSRFG